MPDTKTTKRYHGLDAFRATMMLLGLVFHCAVTYTHIPLSYGWPFRDQSSYYLFDILVYGLHLFRMPAFFLIAGFFAALVFYKRGLGNLLTNRFKRVTLPLILLWIFIVPLTCSGFIFANNISGGIPHAMVIVWNYLMTGTCLLQGELTHLWFLYFLTIFYLLMMCLVVLTNRLNENFKLKFINVFNVINRHPLGTIPVILITFLTLFPMSHAGFETNSNLTPPLLGLAAYGFFFLYGWVLFYSSDLLEVFSERAWNYLVVGILFSALYCYLLITSYRIDLELTHFVTVLIASIGIWCLIPGLLGLYCKYLDQPSPLARYISDASYWMYLIHVPIIIVIAGHLSLYSFSPFLKFLIVYILTNIICIISYDLVVRSTIIGAFLNGKRQPRGLPSR